jgi:hypothetical protein
MPPPPPPPSPFARVRGRWLDGCALIRYRTCVPAHGDVGSERVARGQGRGASGGGGGGACAGNELSSFWLRKTKKVVLAMLMVKVDGEEEPMFFPGMNIEVSMPTGTLCSERNGARLRRVPSALKPAYSPASKSRQMSTFAPSLQPAAGSRSGIVWALSRLRRMRWMWRRRGGGRGGHDVSQSWAVRGGDHAGGGGAARMQCVLRRQAST